MTPTFELAKSAEWPGYLGSPRQSSAALGETIWKSFAAAAVEHALKILDGADPASYARYADLLEKNGLYQGWIRAAGARDDALGKQQRELLVQQAK